MQFRSLNFERYVKLLQNMNSREKEKKIITNKTILFLHIVHLISWPVYNRQSEILSTFNWSVLVLFCTFAWASIVSLSWNKRQLNQPSYKDERIKMEFYMWKNRKLQNVTLQEWMWKLQQTIIINANNSLEQEIPYNWMHKPYAFQNVVRLCFVLERWHLPLLARLKMSNEWLSSWFSWCFLSFTFLFFFLAIFSLFDPLMWHAVARVQVLNRHWKITESILRHSVPNYTMRDVKIIGVASKQVIDENFHFHSAFTQYTHFELSFAHTHAWIGKWWSSPRSEWIGSEFIEYNPLCKHKMRFKSTNNVHSITVVVAVAATAALEYHVYLIARTSYEHFFIGMHGYCWRYCWHDAVYINCVYLLISICGQCPTVIGR